MTSYFKGLAFADARPIQIDLETAGLDPQRDRIFRVAIRDHTGASYTVEDPDEAAFAKRVGCVRECDPT